MSSVGCEQVSACRPTFILFRTDDQIYNLCRRFQIYFSVMVGIVALCLDFQSVRTGKKFFGIRGVYPVNETRMGGVVRLPQVPHTHRVIIFWRKFFIFNRGGLIILPLLDLIKKCCIFVEIKTYGKNLYCM